MASENAAIACVTAVVAVITIVSSLDGRSMRKQTTRKYAIRSDVWQRVQVDENYKNGWYCRELRCTKASFDIIATRIEKSWTLRFKAPNKNVNFTIKDRVAATIYYLAHRCTYAAAGAKFSMSKTRATVYIGQVVEVQYTYKMFISQCILY